MSSACESGRKVCQERVLVFEKVGKVAFDQAHACIGAGGAELSQASVRTQNCQQDVDEEVRAAANLKEDTHGWQDDGQDDLADIAIVRFAWLASFRALYCIARIWRSSTGEQLNVAGSPNVAAFIVHPVSRSTQVRLGSYLAVKGILSVETSSQFQ
ncbi:hypothetical protein E4U30_002839 [Claviceps sp. LM220 group G6]|nr:hypothetical protein E4U15_002656 [Claviceps sp. LM218 group G6]KAG6101160.1 hypothetical protein E4U30_002839 [Claviceps sp. LM220 group G6]